MHLTEIQIRDVRSIRALKWKPPSNKLAGWHVIIGDNGTGKSTFLRAIALALVGPSDALALRQDWQEWLRLGAQKVGRVHLWADWNEKYDSFSGSGALPKNWVDAHILFKRHRDHVDFGRGRHDYDPYRSFWADSHRGWFAASYGPFRRFTGGDREQEKLFHSRPRLARHLSVFGEAIALSESLEWLQSLKFRKLEHPQEGELLDLIIEFVNQEGFLPYFTQLQKVTSDGVFFADLQGNEVTVENLSDGYRSILSMTFELIRQLVSAHSPQHIFSPDGTKVIAPGVVLIDEVDAHLHPTWQRAIGPWLVRHFPNIQFIVTTHSPIICQAAELGSVWRFARPDRDEDGGMVTGPELDRLLYGNVLDAYGTGFFGDDVAQSESSKKKLARLAELNLKELEGKLTRLEKAEAASLKRILPTAAANGISRSRPR